MLTVQLTVQQTSGRVRWVVDPLLFGRITWQPQFINVSIECWLVMEYKDILLPSEQGLFSFNVWCQLVCEESSNNKLVHGRRCKHWSKTSKPSHKRGHSDSLAVNTEDCTLPWLHTSLERGFTKCTHTYTYAVPLNVRSYSLVCNK